MGKKSAISDVAVKIEKGVDIPSAKRKSRSKWNDTVAKMGLGDSVLFGDRKSSTSLVVALKRHSFKPITRSVDGGVRVWKTETTGA